MFPLSIKRSNHDTFNIFGYTLLAYIRPTIFRFLHKHYKSFVKQVNYKHFVKKTQVTYKEKMGRESEPTLQKKLLDEESLVESEPETNSRKPGWKAMPYILGTSLKLL